MSTSELTQIRPYSKFRVSDANGVSFRAMIEPDGRVFLFRPRSSRYGRRYSQDEFVALFTYVKGTSEAEQWQKNVRKVIQKLKRSGLMPWILEVFENLSTMSYEDFKGIKEAYNNRPYIKDAEERLANLKDVLAPYIAKYPFIFDKDINYDYLSGGIADAKLKSMYFGNFNKSDKAQIKDALANKTALTFNRRTSYDVTFSYDPSMNKAFYSEEFKNCGNGHYYLVLDENTALFCESD